MSLPNRKKMLCNFRSCQSMLQLWQEPTVTRRLNWSWFHTAIFISNVWMVQTCDFECVFSVGCARVNQNTLVGTLESDGFISFSFSKYDFMWRWHFILFHWIYIPFSIRKKINAKRQSIAPVRRKMQTQRLFDVTNNENDENPCSIYRLNVEVSLSLRKRVAFHHWVRNTRTRFIFSIVHIAIRASLALSTTIQRKRYS